MSPRIKQQLDGFLIRKAHAGYVLALLMTIASSSYVAQFVNSLIHLYERVAAIEIDRTRGIDDARRERAQLRADIDKQFAELKEDVRELRRPAINKR